MPKHSKNLKYKVLSLRLSDEVIGELKKRRQNAKSWNLLLKAMLYGDNKATKG